MLPSTWTRLDDYLVLVLPNLIFLLLKAIDFFYFVISFVIFTSLNRIEYNLYAYFMLIKIIIRNYSSTISITMTKSVKICIKMAGQHKFQKIISVVSWGSLEMYEIYLLNLWGSHASMKDACYKNWMIGEKFIYLSHVEYLEKKTKLTSRPKKKPVQFSNWYTKTRNDGCIMIILAGIRRYSKMTSFCGSFKNTKNS